jgi:hypothetical protein
MFWKIELTWHAEGRDRKYRTVLEATSFDDARKDAIAEAGLNPDRAVVCTEGQPFNDFEYANVEASKRRFLNSAVAMSPRK